MSLYDFLRSLLLPLKEIDHLLPQRGKIYDLGCGEGTISSYIAHIKTRSVIGVDNDKKRLQKSTQNNLSYNFGDIRNYNLKSPDAVVISDVLHHLTFKDQEKLLTKIAKSLKESGILMIVDIDTSDFFKSKLSRFWDFILYPQGRIYYRDSKNFKPYLSSLGFAVQIQKPIPMSPRSTIIYFCKKQ